MSEFHLSNFGPVCIPETIHPLDAPAERKLFDPALGRMRLTFRVKVVLFVLQGYIGIMVLLVGWKLIAGN